MKNILTMKNSAYNTDNCKVIKFNETNLTLLNEEIEKWTPNVPVVIMAGTGTGKTTWVCNNLLPKVARYDSKLLILCNRSALSEQTKMALIENVLGNSTSIENYGKLKARFKADFENSNRGYCDLGKVIVMTIQAFTSLSPKSNLIKDIGTVVVDEAHYFKADALFNNKTAIGFNKIFDCFTTALKICISATPQNILPDIIKKGCKMAESNDLILFNPIIPLTYNDQVMIMDRQHHLAKNTYYYEKCVLYIFPEQERKYNFLPLSDEGDYYKSLQPLIKKIQQKICDDSKSVFFINNKEVAKKVQKDFGEVAVYIDADSKNKDIIDDEYVVYRRIVASERFSSKVLICTSVFDNGVNFKDDKIKSVFIGADDMVTFKQMLGRVRLPRYDSKNYSVDVYFINYNEEYFTKKLNGYRNLLKELNTFKESSDKIKIFNNALKSNSPILKMLSLEKDNFILHNEFAVEELKRRIEFCSNILYAYRYKEFNGEEFDFNKFYLNHLTENLEDEYKKRFRDCEICIPVEENYEKILPVVETEVFDDFQVNNISYINGEMTYLDVVECWFGRKYSIEALKKFKEKRQKIAEFLEEYVEKKAVPKDQQKIFLYKLKEMVCSLGEKTINGTFEGLQGIKNLLKQLKLPYEIKNKQERIGKDRQTVWEVVRLK